MKKDTQYVVIDERGYIKETAYYRKIAISLWLRNIYHRETWDDLRKRGYRCIKVRLIPVEKKGV